MDEYIKRKTAVRAVMAAKWVDGSDGAMAMGIVASTPAADVAPVVHGAWQVTDRFKACSVCGYAFARLLPDKYCPHCGAKMDGERKDGVDV